MKTKLWVAAISMLLMEGMGMILLAKFATTDDLIMLIKSGIAAIICLQFTFWITDLIMLSIIKEEIHGNKIED